MPEAWDERKAAHLLSRTAFAARAEDVAASVKLGKRETVTRLLSGRSLTGDGVELPTMEQVRIEGKTLKPDSITDAQLYWMYRMYHTEAPLIEKMALFWHNHFAVSYAKVRQTSLMVRQNELFRKMALGSFRELVESVSLDPAMLIWLDANQNRKDAPNENFSREMMELFTLGIGHYTENDVREAARALTGWQADGHSGETAFIRNRHDDGLKTIFHRTGRWDRADLIDILFQQKALPLFLAEKLLRYFAADPPPPAWVNEVARDISENPLIGSALYKLFVSDAFYEPRYRLGLVKSPVDYLIGIGRTLRVPLRRKCAWWLREMGQDLYYPPNVAGWPGGRAWLTTSAMLARCHYAEEAAAFVKPGEFVPALLRAWDSAWIADEWIDRWSRKAGIWPQDGTLRQILSPLFRAAASGAEDDNVVRELVLLLLISPEAQLA